jgi:hypothetical protein
MPAKIIVMPPYDIDLLADRARQALAARGYPPEQIHGNLVYQEVKHQRTLQLKEWRDDRLTKRSDAGEGAVRNDPQDQPGVKADRGELQRQDSELHLPPEE